MVSICRANQTRWKDKKEKVKKPDFYPTVVFTFVSTDLNTLMSPKFPPVSYFPIVLL